jgi:O-6-methylguanine DNA methyltransferase
MRHVCVPARVRLFFDRPPTTAFEVAVHRAVQSVPAGRVATYGDVAAAVGHPRAARAVGNVLKVCPDNWITPWHRVVRSDGHVGGFSERVPRTKILRLQKEGVDVRPDGRIRDFERVRFRPE